MPEPGHPVLLLQPPPWLQGLPQPQPALSGPRALSRALQVLGVVAGLTPHPYQETTASSAVWALADGAGDAEEGRGHGPARVQEGMTAAGRGQGPEAEPTAAGQLGRWSFLRPGLGGGPGAGSVRVRVGLRRVPHTPPRLCLHRWEGRAGPFLHCSAPDDSGVYQGHTSSHRQRWNQDPGLMDLSWSLRGPMGVVARSRDLGSQARTRRGRRVGSTGSGRPVGKSGAAPAWGGDVSSSPAGQTPTSAQGLGTRSWGKSWAVKPPEPPGAAKQKLGPLSTSIRSLPPLTEGQSEDPGPGAPPSLCP